MRKKNYGIIIWNWASRGIYHKKTCLKWQFLDACGRSELVEKDIDPNHQNTWRVRLYWITFIVHLGIYIIDDRTPLHYVSMALCVLSIALGSRNSTASTAIYGCTKTEQGGAEPYQRLPKLPWYIVSWYHFIDIHWNRNMPCQPSQLYDSTYLLSLLQSIGGGSSLTMESSYYPYWWVWSTLGQHLSAYLWKVRGVVKIFARARSYFST